MTWTKETAAAALAATDTGDEALALMARIAQEAGWPLDQDADGYQLLVTEPNVWVACSDGGEDVDIDADSAYEAAKDYVDWDCDDTETSWVHVSVWRRGLDTNGESCTTYAGRHSVRVDPEEPECSRGSAGHDWRAPYDIVGGIRENPGVWGHGGGVVMHEACMICGCARITDTWAQDPSDGSEGNESISYEEGRYAAEVSAYALAQSEKRGAGRK